MEPFLEDPATSPALPVQETRLQQLHRVFDAIDADHDGALSSGELCAWMKKLGLAYTEDGMLRMVDHVDVRRCGSLDFDEFVELNGELDADEAALRTAEARKEAHQKLLIEAFSMFDKDHDGCISPKDLCLALNDLGLAKGKRKEAEYVDMISRVDLDGDGQVSFSEFQNMMDRENV